MPHVLSYLIVVLVLTFSAAIGVAMAKVNPLATLGTAIVLFLSGFLYWKLLPRLVPHWAFSLPAVPEISIGAMTLGIGLILGILFTIPARFAESTE